MISDISLAFLHLELEIITSDVTITVQRIGVNCTEKCHLKKLPINGKYWATFITGRERIIFPSKKIQILKIGNKVVQSKESARDEEIARKEYAQELRIKSNKLKFKGAYHHQKINPDN